MRDIVGLQISRKGRLIYKYHFLGPVDQLPINPQKPAFSEPSEITPHVNGHFERMTRGLREEVERSHWHIILSDRFFTRGSAVVIVIVDPYRRVMRTFSSPSYCQGFSIGPPNTRLCFKTTFTLWKVARSAS